jgi:HD-GYP domain-containing protein (c-di-GMP phosphodiesterase class II)
VAVAKNGMSILRSMAMSVELKYPYMRGHSSRVARLACGIAAGMGISGQSLGALEMACIIHDVGKVLSLDHLHPELSCQLIRPLGLPWSVADIVLQHHERLDGSGYPKGLSARDMCLEARILAVADAVDRCSFRPPAGLFATRPSLNQMLLENRSAAFDEKVVDAAVEFLGLESIPCPAPGKADG